MTGGDDDNTGPAPAARPSWGWAIGSAALVVGLITLLFPVAPLWTIVAFAAAVLLLRLTPLGARYVQGERVALLGGLAANPWLRRHAGWVVAALFVAPLLALPGIAWGLSDPDHRWDGGVMWVVAVFGFGVYTFALEERNAGQRARWWPWWVAFASLLGGFLLVGGPARLRWAYCEPRLTDAVKRGEELSIDNTGRFCWHDVPRLEVDGETRFYVDGGENGSLEGSGLVYSPDGAIETAGGIRSLVDLGDGWYWFETGSVVKSFWLDG